MTFSDDLRSEVGNILRTSWNAREGARVPDTSDIALGNDAVRLTATVLYADLVESTTLVRSFKDWFAAEVYKCYLRCACRVIQRNNGVVTAFDGDRIMAVYIDGQKNTEAVGSALEINDAVSQIINPMIKEVYPSTTYAVKHAIGIDTSALFVARTGVRGSNDLVWVGRAANYAAKLCSLREADYATWITSEVFGQMNDSVKYAKGEPGGESMWEARTWTPQGITVYRSRWRRVL